MTLKWGKLCKKKFSHCLGGEKASQELKLSTIYSTYGNYFHKINVAKQLLSLT